MKNNTLINSISTARDILTAQIAAAYDADDLALQDVLCNARSIMEKAIDDLEGSQELRYNSGMNIAHKQEFAKVVEPGLDVAKNTEGVYDYLIVCDERNNTPDIIDQNELVVDIYLKPVRAECNH